MSDEERDEMIRIATAFEGFVNQYAKDEERKEIERREDRDHTQRWRNGFHDRLTKIDERLQPIERDHFFVMRTLKWGGGLAAVGAALAKLWESLRSHLS